MSSDIILLDIPTSKSTPNSMNTWKVRLALNYKKLQYRTQWVPTTEIERTCKPLGIPPTGTKPDGTPHYTLPAIIDRTADTSNPVFLSDSLPIIEYLERTYPPIPGRELIPANTNSFQFVFYKIIMGKLSLALRELCVMALYRAKRPGEEQEDFRRRMEARLGVTLESIEKQGEEREQAFKSLEETFALLAVSIDRNESGENLMGQHISFADLALCAWCICIKSISPDDVWARILSWNGGRWGVYVESFRAYMDV